MNKQISECVGLWLAEGDNKTISEITFTNNCIELILFFHETINSIYTGDNKPRIYVYSPSKRKLFNKIGNIKIRYYQDIRAKKTYYIYRLADVNFVKEWKSIVNKTLKEKINYSRILRGFFAGEGNIKHNPKNNNSRSIRISQSKRYIILENILNHFNIEHTFESQDRNYWIYGCQLEKTNKLNIAELHPEKQFKFARMINSLKEPHYSKGFLKKNIEKTLIKPTRTLELSKKFNRSPARILDVLRELKTEKKISYMKIKNKTVWAKKKIITEILLNDKKVILTSLDKFKKICDLSRDTNIPRKTIRKKLRLLKKEELVKQMDTEWNKTEKGKSLTCGIDEAGNE
ncbi:hypothetical protein HON86_03375 [Candidatus Woesearchaeota archaeon]|jgi:DNA-binding transcriptional ArsR family regulator|nr:hypothetical protein [Candidatus Woesearchaeota archaeon]